MAEPTDRDREIARKWATYHIGEHVGVFVVEELADMIATAREEGRREPMTEPTDRDREMAVNWMGASDEPFVDVDRLTALIARARELGEGAREREQMTAEERNRQWIADLAAIENMSREECLAALRRAAKIKDLSGLVALVGLALESKSRG